MMLAGMRRLALVAAPSSWRSSCSCACRRIRLPVRRMVLRYTIAEVRRRYAIRIEAARLDYNLAALTIGLAQVRIAADRTPDLHFSKPTTSRRRWHRARWAVWSRSTRSR